MKIERVIQLAGLMERGNVLPEELAIEFLSEFDGMIQSDIMLHAPEEIVHYDSVQQELLLRPPHDQIYVSYLVAMIRQCQGEFEGYNNAQEIVEDKLKTFRRWYIHHYRPADTGSRDYTGGTSGGGFGFAYLSAYGLDVKHGYQGTEEEWLQSLKGEKGDTGEAARMRYDAERDMIQWGVGDEWYDLYTMAEVLAPLYAKLDEMTGRVEQAAADADAAARAAQTSAGAAAASVTSAKSYSVTAAQKADDAAGSAQLALQSERAAETAAGNAAGSADDAQTQAETAGNYAESAKQALAGISEAIGQHDTSVRAHQDLRLELQKLQGYVTTLLDSDDTTLDQLSEIVAYIKSNRTLIEAITTSKVSVADIVNDLVTNVTDRPLSAAQGVVLKQMLEQAAARIGVTAADAGALVRVGSDGRLQKLEIGEGLEVVGDKLTATGGGGGGSISAVGDGDDIVISTTFAVRAEGDDIIIGG